MSSLRCRSKRLNHFKYSMHVQLVALICLLKCAPMNILFFYDGCTLISSPVVSLQESRMKADLFDCLLTSSGLRMKS